MLLFLFGSFKEAADGRKGPGAGLAHYAVEEPQSDKPDEKDAKHEDRKHEQCVKVRIHAHATAGKAGEVVAPLLVGARAVVGVRRSISGYL